MQHLPHPKNEEGLYICQVCKGEFLSLAQHIKHHRMKKWEYLIEYGMSQYTEITSPTQREKGREPEKNRFGRINWELIA